MEFPANAKLQMGYQLIFPKSCKAQGEMLA